MDIIELDEGWADRYDLFCAQAPEHMLYNTWRYRRFLKELLNCRPVYLGAVEQGELKAVLPLMSKDGPLGTVLNSLPFFGSYGGVIGIDPDARNLVWQSFQESISKPHVAAATVINNPLVDQPPTFPWSLTDERIGQFTNLQVTKAGRPTGKDLLSMIKSSARRNVLKANASGVTVRVENDALAALQDIHRENMREIGGKAKPSKFFSLLPIFFEAGKHYNIYVAKVDGGIVSALLIFYGGRIVEYFLPATIASFRSKQPSAAILHKAMLDAANEGFDLWNWGGTWTSQEGVLRFKEKWGAWQRTYRYFTWIRNPSISDYPPNRLLGMYPDFYVAPFGKIPAATRVPI